MNESTSFMGLPIMAQSNSRAQAGLWRAIRRRVVGCPFSQTDQSDRKRRGDAKVPSIPKAAVAGDIHERIDVLFLRSRGLLLPSTFTSALKFCRSFVLRIPRRIMSGKILLLACQDSLGRFPWFLPMASRCAGSLRRIIPLSPLSSFGVRSRRASPSSSFAADAAAPRPTRRFSSRLRVPVELGSCVESLFPLHSAVAAARLTSRLSTTTHGGRSLSQGILCRTTPGL